MFTMLQPPPIKRETQLHGYLFKRELGSGQFSVVWEALHLKSNEIVAIKCVRLFSQQTRERHLGEIEIMKRLDHPFIVRYFDSFEEEDVLYIVIEFVPCGTLVDYSNRHERLPEDVARSIFSELLCAVESLHSEYHVVHRDIKTENVLLDRHKNVRLVDFGLSDTFETADQQFTRKCGSQAYISPEMARGQPYTVKTDIWSLGVVLFAITHGTLPFDTVQKVIFTDAQYDASLSRELRDLMLNVLRKEPSERFGIEEIKAHPWMSGVKDVKFKRGVDPNKIVARMKELGIDCDGIEKEDPDSERMVIWRIVSRKYLIDENVDIRPKDNFVAAFRKQRQELRPPPQAAPKASPSPKATPKSKASATTQSSPKPAATKAAPKATASTSPKPAAAKTAPKATASPSPKKTAAVRKSDSKRPSPKPKK